MQPRRRHFDRGGPIWPSGRCLCEDLHREINAQTWRLVTFVCSFGTALVAGTYFIATHFR